MNKWLRLLLALVIMLLLVTGCDSVCTVECKKILGDKTYTKFDAKNCNCRFGYAIESCTCRRE